MKGNKMGGSLIVDKIEAAPYDLEYGLAEIYTILQTIKPHNPGWKPHIAIEEYLAGSSRVAIDNRVLLRNKGIMLGDIDVFVDRDYYESFCENMIKAIDNDTIIFDRKSKTRATSLMNVAGQHRQVDFIPCEFDNGQPATFFKFSHSSSFVDLSKGIKGYAHKLLCRAYTAGTKYHFSVDYGLREDGSDVYDTNFISVVNKVFKCNAYNIWTFTSLLTALKHKPKEQQTLVIEKFAQLVFGADRQKSSRFPEKDIVNMEAIYKELEMTRFATPRIHEMMTERKGEYNAR